MRAPDLVLRCYIKPSAGQWVAICVDLCLAAQADTAAEARRMLERQIVSYVEEALTVDRDFAGELLARKAPLYQRAEYFVIRVLHAAHLFKRQLGQAFKTILPVHVGPNCHA